MSKVFSRHADEAETVSVVSDVYRVMATSAETGGLLGLVDAIVPPGGGPPPHVHSREDEFFYVIEGEITFHVESREPIRARAGTFVFSPRGVRHRFANESARPARMLFGVLPGGMEKMFIETGARLEPGVKTPAPVTGAAIERLVKTAAERYGVKIEGKG